jgi:5-methylcytosine-specific restriction enzyme A
MPSAAPRPCRKQGCPALVAKGYCDAHKPVEVVVKHEYQQYKGSAHSRGYGAEWRRLRATILARDPICKGGWDITCGGRNLSQHCDHIVRKEDGGTDDPSNLQGLCAPCHRMKSACELAGEPIPERVQFIIP